MAKLPAETSQTIALLKQRLLDIIDNATAAEFELFERLGETAETIIPLDDLRGIIEQSTSRFSQFPTFQLQVARSQPIASADLLQLLNQRIASTEDRIPALERSLEEIKQDWSLL